MDARGVGLARHARPNRARREKRHSKGARDRERLQRQRLAWEYSFDEDYDNHVLRIARSPSDPGASACPREPDGLLPTAPVSQLCIDTGSYGYVRAVSAGRILVNFGDLLALIDRDGSARDLPLPFSADTDAIALSGTDVVVVRASAKKLGVYDGASGSLEAQWPVPAARDARLLSVAGGIAVYSSNGIRLVRLRDGKVRTLQIPSGRRPVAAVVEPAGLFVLYRTKRGERLGFVPIAKLLRAA
jgi:hypothetical protein